MSESGLNPSYSSAGLRTVVGGTSPASHERTLDVAWQFASSRRSSSRKPDPSGQPHPPTMLTDESLVHGGNLVDVAFACGPILPETALILRTLGSTTSVGSLVATPWDAPLASAEATEEALGGPGHRVTCLLTNHTAGSQTQFRSAAVGLIFIDIGTGRPEDLVRAADFDEKSALPYASLIPTQLRRPLASSAARVARRFDVVLVGEAVAGARFLEAARATDLKVVTTCGMTETYGSCVYDGSPIGDIRVAIENDRIVLPGSAVALGYVGGPDLAGTFRTSDVGRLETGRLTVLGRANDAITTGGMTIMSAAVGGALTRSGAGENVVTGIDDDEWGEIAVAVVGVTGLPRPTALRTCKAIAEEHGKVYAPRSLLSSSDLGLSDPGHSEPGLSGPEPSGTGFGGLPLTALGKPDRRAIRGLVRRALDRHSPSS